jgi:hypothetical protein
VRGPTKRLVLAGVPLLILLVPGIAAAQVQVTPNFSLTPTKTVTPWVYQMAIGATILGILVLVGVGVSYLRFAPSFFGRREPAARPAPGTRPALLAQAQAPARAPVGAARPASASSGGGVAVAERPAPAPAPAAQPASAPAGEGQAAATEATDRPTAGPMSEPAVQADAVGEAEAAAPEARPSAKTPEEVGEPAEAAAPEAATEPAETETPAPAPAVSASHGAQPDQETFDRVLEEQLAKGVDRRVAEGRARAAAVVAARKKAQG